MCAVRLARASAGAIGSTDRHDPDHPGPAEIDVTVEDGETIELKYKPPWIRGRPGKVSVVS